MTALNMNRIGERAMVVGSGCAIVGAVAVFDETVRRNVAGLLTGDGSQLVTAGSRLQGLVRTTAETIGYQGSEHASLTMFAVAAVVLLVFMLRT